MKASFVTILLTLLVSGTVFAHGMNKPGPHNGYIRMPGAYHVELVTDKNILKVYVLDMSFKPLPMTGATAKITLKGFKEVSLDCIKGAEFFSCDTKDTNMKKYTEILIESSKAGERAATSTYKLPLSF